MPFTKYQQDIPVTPKSSHPRKSWEISLVHRKSCCSLQGVCNSRFVNTWDAFMYGISSLPIFCWFVWKVSIDNKNTSIHQRTLYGVNHSYNVAGPRPSMVRRVAGSMSAVYPRQCEAYQVGGPKIQTGKTWTPRRPFGMIFFFWWFFFGLYHRIHRHFAPPFGEMCCAFSKHLQQIQVRNGVMGPLQTTEKFLGFTGFFHPNKWSCLTLPKTGRGPTLRDQSANPPPRSNIPGLTQTEPALWSGLVNHFFFELIKPLFLRGVR